MLRLANRTACATAAGLLGLLVAAPPPASAADDEGRRSREHVARQHPSHRGDGKDEKDEKDRDGRHERRREDHGRDQRRDLAPQAQAERPRYERPRYERRPAQPQPQHRPPAPVARHDRDRHEQHDRDRSEHRDRSEWRDDRREWDDDRHEWRDDRREEWREHQEWSHARYTAQHGQRWHWHGNRWCPPGHRHPPGRRVGWYAPHDDWRWARYRRPVIVHSQYYCAPCSNWFANRYGFDQHVYGYHQMPQLSFANAVSQVVWGLVYFGN